MCPYPPLGPPVAPPPQRSHGHMVPYRSVPRFFSLSLAATVERLLHPYRVVLSRVDFWEASGTGLSARRRRQLAKSTLETRRITGKPSSPFASPVAGSLPPLSSSSSSFSPSSLSSSFPSSSGRFFISLSYAIPLVAEESVRSTRHFA